MKNLLNVIWFFFGKRGEFQKDMMQTLKEIKVIADEKEKENKIDQWCETVINYFKCSECKEPITIISHELKYCNKCGFSFTKNTLEL